MMSTWKSVIRLIMCCRAKYPFKVKRATEQLLNLEGIELIILDNCTERVDLDEVLSRIGEIRDLDYY
jgi:hypothetical protein